jgi:hypothetical protein
VAEAVVPGDGDDCSRGVDEVAAVALLAGPGVCEGSPPGPTRNVGAPMRGGGVAAVLAAAVVDGSGVGSVGSPRSEHATKAPTLKQMRTRRGARRPATLSTHQR